MAQSSADDNGICYVLWMTSYFPIMGPMACGIGNIYMGTMLEQVLINVPTYLPGSVTLFDFTMAAKQIAHWGQTVMSRTALSVKKGWVQGNG